MDSTGAKRRRLLESLQNPPIPPRPIVRSHLADEELRAGVLNLGGVDVRATPFMPREVFRVIRHAWDSWHRERHRLERLRR